MFLETRKYTDTKRAYEEIDQQFAYFSTSTMRQWLSIWQWATSSLIRKVVTDSERTYTSYARGQTSYGKALFSKILQSHCLHRNNHLFDDAVTGASIRVVIPRIVYFASIPFKHLIDLQCLSSCLKDARYYPNWQSKACFPRCWIL